MNAESLTLDALIAIGSKPLEALTNDEKEALLTRMWSRQGIGGYYTLNYGTSQETSISFVKTDRLLQEYRNPNSQLQPSFQESIKAEHCKLTLTWEYRTHATGMSPGLRGALYHSLVVHHGIPPQDLKTD